MSIKYCLLIILFTFSFSSEAIVIRHDVDDKQYHTSHKSFPPLATLYSDGVHGTLIDSAWVVTAAHATYCINSGSFISIAGELHQVENAYHHQDYAENLAYDVALFKLKEPVKDIVPAKIYTQTNELNQSVWFIGRGGTGNGMTGQTQEYSDVLRRAQNKVSAVEGANLKFKFDKGVKALPLEGVSGAGDSGGPAYILERNQYQLLGISSRLEGDAIGKYGITEIYARASYFRPWINKMINSSPDKRLSISKAVDEELPDGCSKIMLKPKKRV